MLLAGLGGISLLPASVQSAAAVELPPSIAYVIDKLDVDAAARLGRTYLKRYPENGDIESLLDALLQGSEGSAEMPEFLSRKVREDFADGRVVEVEDWQISETEARIFAAIALTS
jgi:hypothetical protein